ncbi:hypothetical protein DPMN_157321 [Dreissena polymorpha]|uniref:Uncharacterized protein n=1 Tax=Dreissena polymorpha TaxID=45954 RepID=A0A9D4EHN5_DREPO|nr:hypothetical protein DPMN_157321 [Dreissena polymorpha]
MPLYQFLSNASVLNGTLIRLSYDSSQTTVAPETEKDSYDGRGAMHFIVATVLVYSIFGVFCTLLVRIKRYRGERHLSYIQDESIGKYLKKETILKMDGERIKMKFHCQRVAEQVKQIEGKRHLLEIDREISAGDFTLTTDERHRRKRPGTRKGLENTLGIMGVSLLHIGNLTENAMPSDAADDIESDDPDLAENIALKTIIGDQGTNSLSADIDGSNGDLLTEIQYIDDNTITNNEAHAKCVFIL